MVLFPWRLKQTTVKEFVNGKRAEIKKTRRLVVTLQYVSSEKCLVISLPVSVRFPSTIQFRRTTGTVVISPATHHQQLGEGTSLRLLLYRPNITVVVAKNTKSINENAIRMTDVDCITTLICKADNLDNKNR